MKVGTSLGATKGLLLRGGSVLERFSTVNTIVFDKTGTLTIGRPIVTKVVSQGQGHQEDADARLSAYFECIYTTSLLAVLGIQNAIHFLKKDILIFFNKKGSIDTFI